jgi:hypothetical protein
MSITDWLMYGLRLPFWLNLFRRGELVIPKAVKPFREIAYSINYIRRRAPYVTNVQA